jgi:flagellar L-ring protein precursor FlgH
MTTSLRTTLLLTSALLLSGCCNMADRLSAIGEPPPVSPISNPTHERGYMPVSMPMPEPQVTERQPNSLWRSGARAFFKDQRAAKIGDLMTVIINIDDQAQVNNSSTRNRSNVDSMGITNLFGLETQVDQIFPTGTTPGALLNTNGSLADSGTGAINRSERIELQVAAVITQLLPNGNMVLKGSQEIRVNNEVRVLNISGIIRPEDISSSNTISYEKIAEARISYGGRGQITDVQQPPYGHQVLDIISPF